jgi:small subunit ribosomal protein S17
MEVKRNLRKERVGIVVSDKMDKTVVVAEVKKVKHPKYHKFVLRTKKYMVHDEKNDAHPGDKVRIMKPGR